MIVLISREILYIKYTVRIFSVRFFPVKSQRSFLYFWYLTIFFCLFSTKGSPGSSGQRCKTATCPTGSLTQSSCRCRRPSHIARERYLAALSWPHFRSQFNSNYTSGGDETFGHLTTFGWVRNICQCAIGRGTAWCSCSNYHLWQSWRYCEKDICFWP